MNQRKTWSDIPNSREKAILEQYRKESQFIQFYLVQLSGVEFGKFVRSQCTEYSVVELSSFVSLCSSVQVSRGSWSQRISSQRIRTQC